MNKYLKRLVYRSEDEKFNPLMHIFFLVSLAFGVGFAFLPALSGANQTILYTLTKFSLGTTVTSVWGVGLLLITALNTVILATRVRVLGGITAGMGFMLWLYSAFIYCYGQFWLGLFGLSIPNMLFWWWYYYKIKAYHRNPPENVS